MAIEESDIRVGAEYETPTCQLRRVVRVMPLHVIYEIRTPRPPFYRVSVLKPKFAAAVVKVRPSKSPSGASAHQVARHRSCS